MKETPKRTVPTTLPLSTVPIDKIHTELWRITNKILKHCGSHKKMFSNIKHEKRHEYGWFVIRLKLDNYWLVLIPFSEQLDHFIIEDKNHDIIYYSTMKDMPHPVNETTWAVVEAFRKKMAIALF